jgi:hypothetical protein
VITSKRTYHSQGRRKCIQSTEKPRRKKPLGTSDRFLRRLTSGFYLILCVARRVISKSSDQISSFKYILILSCYLYLGFPGGFDASGFPITILNTFLISSCRCYIVPILLGYINTQFTKYKKNTMRATYPTHHTVFDLITLIRSGGEHAYVLYCVILSILF